MVIKMADILITAILSSRDVRIRILHYKDASNVGTQTQRSSSLLKHTHVHDTLMIIIDYNTQIN